MASPELRIDANTMNRVNRILCAISLLVGVAFLVGGGWWIHRNHLDEFLGLIVKSDTAEGTVIENRAIVWVLKSFRVAAITNRLSP